MKIKYKFVDGTVAEVEVDESIGTVIKESRRLEGNLARKESYHCYSLEAMQYEGAEYSDGETKIGHEWIWSVSPRRWTGCRKCSAEGS